MNITIQTQNFHHILLSRQSNTRHPILGSNRSHHQGNSTRKPQKSTEWNHNRHWTACECKWRRASWKFTREYLIIIPLDNFHSISNILWAYSDVWKKIFEFSNIVIRVLYVISYNVISYGFCQIQKYDFPYVFVQCVVCQKRIYL